MNSWKRVSRDMVRIFFSNDQHIAVVLGRKPRPCAHIELADVTRNPKLPILSVQCTCERISEHAFDQGFETYCLVKPVLAGPRVQNVSVLHREGCEVVAVETIRSPRARHHVSKTTIADQAQVSGTPELIASAMGFSPNFSLDEAFNDALHKLRSSQISSIASNEPSMIDVVSMGAMYGGFSEYSRLFVRVEQSKLLDAIAVSNRQTTARRNEKLGS